VEGRLVNVLSLSWLTGFSKLESEAVSGSAAKETSFCVREEVSLLF